jgi:hypothetical protein
MTHNAAWQTPQPLWSRFGATAALGAVAPDQARPAILRFDSDEYMEQVLAALEQAPATLGERIARPETWRLPPGETPDLIERVPLPRIAKTLARLRKNTEPRSTLAASTASQQVSENSVARSLPLKLYQPAHQRYYLLAANLVCAQPGLPDRGLATGGSEQVNFVVRRMLPPVPAIPGVDRVEHAFVKDASGARWQRLADPAVVARGEELLPLFSMGFTADNGQPRRMHAGVVPVGRREEYMSTRAQVSTTGDVGVAAEPSPVATRKEQFKTDVSEPWKNIVRSAVYAKARINDPGDENADPPSAADVAQQATAVNQQAQGQSWLVLLDFADYLATHVRKVWAAVESPALGGALTDGAKTLFDWLDNPSTRPSTTWTGLPFANITLREALKRIRSDAARAGLEGATRLYPDAPGSGLAWPDCFYLLAGVRTAGLVCSVDGLQVSLGAENATPDVDDLDALSPHLTVVQQEAEDAAARIDKLVQMVVAAIDLAQPAQPAPPLPFAARLRDAYATTQGDDGWFVMRCVYLRRDCGPLHPALLSEPTSRFQLASFFDSDAPARPIRIALPLDTTPAGLRKHQKNAAFVMSDVLCGQVQRAKGLGFIDLVRSVLPWPLHKDLDTGGMGPCQGGSPQASLGMICSLSIPIITICALILLMIIVSLLDFIFRWMPYFVMCFPVPKLKGKKESA